MLEERTTIAGRSDLTGFAWLLRLDYYWIKPLPLPQHSRGLPAPYFVEHSFVPFMSCH